MGRKRTWTDADLKQAVASSSSFAGVLKRLGLRVGGGTQTCVKAAIRTLQLGTEHFTGQGHKKGKRSEYPRAAPLNEILVKDSRYSRAQLKRRLRQANVLPYLCAVCRLEPFWNGEPLVLVIDHINGVNNDNRRENLRWLCPNCNSQTPTFAGRNRKNKS